VGRRYAKRTSAIFSAITRRNVLKSLAASLVGLAGCGRKSTDPLTADVAEMLMLCFYGSTTWSVMSRMLAAHLAAGRIGGVVFDASNVGSRQDVIDLVQMFCTSAPTVPLIAIDHEGGSVQRLKSKHGFTTLPRALVVAQTVSVDQARSLYAQAASEMAAIGFNLNLAPVVDLHDPANPPIGHFGRAFASDPETVTSYAEAFIDGFASANVLCAPKHFPGHGHSLADSHYGLPDITSTWSEKELEPYARLIADGRAKIIMGGHLRLATIEREALPTTLSRAATHGLLREKLGFNGVIMTDSLDMDAVLGLVSRREAVIKAIAAGNDLLMIKNVGLFDPYLPQNVVIWVRDAIERGVLRERDIIESADRVRKLKQEIGGRSMSALSV
jgi:beta-N-acetylhexosaminidase